MTEVKRAKLDTLTPDHANANKGTERGRYALEASLRQYGAGRSILLDKNGRIIAGNKTVETAADVGLDDVLIVETDGKQIVAVQRTDLDIDSEAGRGLAYADNRVGQLSLDWDAEQVLADLNAGVDLSALWRQDELDEMIASINGAADLLGVAKDAKPNPRKLPIDVIFCWGGGDNSCCIPVRAGWMYGIRSGDVQTDGKGVCPIASTSPRHKVQFIDNDFHDYDHAHHAEIVRQFRPKYATVRDIMTEQQCKEAGIEYYPFEQVMDWAAELAEYAQNVIVIPKYDCLDQIPANYMLGYSVPTSYGGTPLPVEIFKGRRVHLLGGSWKAQLAHMAALGDDVVSLDNNHINIIASQWGQFNDKDGNTKQMKDVGFGDLTNVRDAAMCLSIGLIGARINELYPVTVNQEENG